MNLQAAQKIANAVLYEGYMLYPYRPSAVKNRQRFNFGVVYPTAYCEGASEGDASMTQTECLLRADRSGKVEVHVKFLQIVDRVVLGKSPATGEFESVEGLEVDGRRFNPWQEAVEQGIAIGPLELRELAQAPRDWNYEFAEGTTSEIIGNPGGGEAGKNLRHRECIRLKVTATAREISSDVVRLSVRVTNTTTMSPSTDRSRALLRASVSTHVILGVEGGEFLSLIDPPADLRYESSQCQNIGLFPVLVGEDGRHDTVLASPIILYDYPQVAPESAGELFDGTEIDEILSLRILTLTEEEKREMRSSDERSRMILDRTESLPAEQFMKLHGVLRNVRTDDAQDGSERHE